MKSFFSGGALLVSTFFLSSLFLSAQPSLAETLFSQFQKQSVPRPADQQPAAGGLVSSTAGKPSEITEEASEPVIAAKTPTAAATNPNAAIPESEAVLYIATAYSLRGKTASGRYVSQGIIAADPRILPLGSRVRLEAGRWSGEYLVADTGGAIRGRKIDIWTPSSREAMKFGRRKVKLTVLSYPPRRASRKRV